MFQSYVVMLVVTKSAVPAKTKDTNDTQTPEKSTFCPVCVRVMLSCMKMIWHWAATGFINKLLLGCPRHQLVSISVQCQEAYGETPHWWISAANKLYALRGRRGWCLRTSSSAFLSSASLLLADRFFLHAGQW